jgi:hypothetical protein
MLASFATFLTGTCLFFWPSPAKLSTPFCAAKALTIVSLNTLVTNLPFSSLSLYLAWLAFFCFISRIKFKKPLQVGSSVKGLCVQRALLNILDIGFSRSYKEYILRSLYFPFVPFLSARYSIFKKVGITLRFLQVESRTARLEMYSTPSLSTSFTTSVSPSSVCAVLIPIKAKVNTPNSSSFNQLAPVRVFIFVVSCCSAKSKASAHEIPCELFPVSINSFAASFTSVPVRLFFGFAILFFVLKVK